MRIGPSVSVAFLAAILGSMNGLAQPVDDTPDQPGKPPTDAPPLSPGVQRLQIRQDTLTERETFLRRRQELMQQQSIERVQPLPPQKISPPLSKQQR